MPQSFPRRALIIWLAVIFLAAASWDAWLWTFTENDTIWNFLYNIVYGLLYFFAAAICFYGYKRLGSKGRLAHACRLWGYGMLVWGLGLVVWTYYNLGAGQEVPYPSLADVFFVAFYPLLALGIMHLHSFSTQEKSNYFSLANAPVAIIATFVVLVFLRQPELSAELPLLERATNVAYSLGDAFLLSVAFGNLPAIVHGLKKAYWWLIASLFVLTAADILFSYRTATETYWNGDISDVLFTIFPVVFSIGVIRMLEYWTTQKARI